MPKFLECDTFINVFGFIKNEKKVYYEIFQT